MTMPPESIDQPPETAAEKLRDAMACLVGAVAAQGEKAFDALGLRQPAKVWSVQIDVVETSEQVLVTVDLPGVDPAGIEIELAGNMLTLKADQPEPPLPKGAKRHRQERPPRKFARSIPLPVPVDATRVDAQSKLGVLFITLARQEPSRPTQIRVSPA
jgi:HSP20 family protein